MRKTIKRLASGLLSLAVVAQLFSTVPFHALAVEGSSQISSSTVWSYLDDGTDPALGLPDRTDWADPTFNDSAWNTATGSFGAKNGQIADLGGGYTPHTLLDQYKEGQEEQEIDKEAFFFRTTVNVADASQVKQITAASFMMILPRSISTAQRSPDLTTKRSPPTSSTAAPMPEHPRPARSL